MNSWWDTPSNSEFLSYIADQSWLGNIVLVYVPKHLPAGFIPGLKRVLNKRDVKHIERLNLKNYNPQNFTNLEEVLYDHFELGSESKYIPKKIKDIFHNLQADEIGALFLENISSPFKKHFCVFIDALRRHLLNINTNERQKVICIIDSVNITYDDIPDEVGIKKFSTKRYLTNLIIYLDYGTF